MVIAARLKNGMGVMGTMGSMILPVRIIPVISHNLPPMSSAEQIRRPNACFQAWQIIRGMSDSQAKKERAELSHDLSLAAAADGVHASATKM
ncbi:MAG: hypothetical protein C0404_10355 [Verrucomicrobia bacterium]|nr:hypothetical protein [Verrucomicrobiota bacterium]